MLAHVEAVAFAAKQVFSRHFEVVDLDLRVAAAEDVRQRAFGRHRLDVAFDLITGVRQFDEERRELPMARGGWVGLRHHERDVGHTRRGRKPFFAVEHVRIVALAVGARLHPGRVGAGCLFGHRIADPFVAVQQWLQELLFLMRRAVFEQRQHRGVVRALRVHRQRAEITFAEFHLHERICERPEAHTAVLFRNERAPESLRARLFAQAREDSFVVFARKQALLSRHTFFVYPLANTHAQRFRFVRYRKINRHRDLSFSMSMSLASPS